MNTNKQQEFLTIRDLWEIFIANIKLFITSVSIAVFISVMYFFITPPIYQRTASILIKDNEKGKSINSANAQGFEELGLFNSNTNLNNEIELIKTPSYMEEVVNRLNLTYNYYEIKNFIRKVDLYNNTPFKVVINEDLNKATISFNITYKDVNSYILSDLVINEEEFNNTFNLKNGEILNTKYGEIKIINTALTVDSLIVDKSYCFNKKSIKEIASYYKSSLNVALRNKDAGIVDLTIKDANPYRAENILNTLISIYNENWIKDKNEVTFNTSKFIGERLDIIQNELNEVDDNISDYKSKNLMPDYAAVTGLHLSQSNETKALILDLNNQLSMAKYIQSYLLNATNKDQLLPVNTGIQSTAIENLIKDFNEQMLKKNVLLENSSINNPLVIDLASTLNSLKGVINKSVEDYIKTLNIQIQSAQNEDKKNKEYLISNPKQAKDLIGVERQQKVKEGLYLFLLQKREENELTQAFSAYNTKVVSLADGLSYPIEPRKTIVLLFALAIGIILPIVYLIIKESFNTLIESRKDLEGLNIPFIGSIPLVEDKKKKLSLFRKKSKKEETHNVIKSGSRNIANESFRILRTNLDFITNKENRCNIVQVISLLAASGKSFIVANLSLSMSLKNGSRVLIIDADMRRGTLSKYIDSPKVGLSNYLSGKTQTIEEIIYKDLLQNNCDIIPVGVRPPNPTELLLNDRFASLINKLKEHYDYIFIDCPPTEVVPDSGIVAPFCNASIFVVRAGNLDKRLLPDVVSVYESKKYNNMCLVLNGVNYGKGGRYGYGYGKYGSYGYGYGSYYGNDSEDENSGGIY